MGDSAGSLSRTSELTSANTHDAVVHFVILMSCHIKAVYSWTFFSFQFWKQTGYSAGQTGEMTLSAGLNPVATERRQVRLLPFEVIGNWIPNAEKTVQLLNWMDLFTQVDTSHSNNFPVHKQSNVRQQHQWKEPEEAATRSPGGRSRTLKIPLDPRSRSSGSRRKSQVASWAGCEWAAGAPDCWLTILLNTALKERKRGRGRERRRGFLIASSSCRTVVKPLLIPEMTCWDVHYWNLLFQPVTALCFLKICCIMYRFSGFYICCRVVAFASGIKLTAKSCQKRCQRL